MSSSYMNIQELKKELDKLLTKSEKTAASKGISTGTPSQSQTPKTYTPEANYERITYRTAMGLIKLALRYDLPSSSTQILRSDSDIKMILDVLGRGEYSPDEKKKLNWIRENEIAKKWRFKNFPIIRKLQKENKEILFLDIDSPEDNPRGVKDTSELVLNNRQDLLRCNIAVIYSSKDKEIVIQKSRYF